MKQIITLVAVLLAQSLLPAILHGEPPVRTLPSASLILDLDADRGLTLDGERVTVWRNQVVDFPAKDFVQRDEGRKGAGSGCPTLRRALPELGGHNALAFLQQELVCMNDDDFDGLTKGGGATWVAVLAARPQRVGLKDVNSIFGNLKNSDNFEGVWGCLKDDNTLWWGARNGVTFGRFDANNPQLLGPKLETGRFYVIAGRIAAGTGKVKFELFVNDLATVTSADFPVNEKANSSRMAVGQERDATNHPGHESFDGDIARFIIWQRPLDDTELASVLRQLRAEYHLGEK